MLVLSFAASGPAEKQLRLASRLEPSIEIVRPRPKQLRTLTSVVALVPIDRGSSRTDTKQRVQNLAFLADCERIHREWHERAKAGDTNGLLALYADDAVLETPLVQAIFDGRPSGTLRGHREIRPFFVEGARRRPNDFVRWHRSGRWLTDGERLLVWEYPRAAPDGDQVDLVEVMEIADGRIQYHRVYWGWFGTALLTRSAVDKARKAA